MWQLKEIKYKDIEKYDNDYCRRSGDVEVVEAASYYGIFVNGIMVSYFAIQDAPNDGIFIRRGYVLPQYRHSGVWQQSIHLLEQAVKTKGYRSISFASNRNPFAYMRLFKNTGFKPVSIEFKKYIGD